MNKVILAALLFAAPLIAQDTTGRGGRGGGGRGVVVTDTARARSLFVSKDYADLAGCGDNDCVRDKTARAKADSTNEARARGVMEFRKVTYKSRVDGLEIPAYLFAPLAKNPSKQAALVWVHGGVHSNWGTSMWPFVKEAVQKGYVVITPDYRGSTGYGNDYYRKIDYGGKEVDDVLSSVDFLQTLPFVDMTRLGIMGWSHGGFITAHILFRDGQPFRAGAPIVPVTNLIFRLSDHGPGYQRSYASEEGIQGLPFEKVEEYIKRSPVFHVENLKVPILVHVATNDCDVFYRENQQMVFTLRALKPELAETKIYVNPPQGSGGCGHTFSRRVNADATERDDSPEQIDSWNRTWTFFEWNLRPLNLIRTDNHEWQHDPSVASPRVQAPTVVELDTTGMFQAKFTAVGDKMFVAGQPTERGLREMKARGVTTVVNLRSPPEMARVPFDEEALVKQLGMKYVYLPMRGTAELPYSPAAVKSLAAAIASADGKVLLHCTIAWRASHLWAAYLIQEKHVPVIDALASTRLINLMDDMRMSDRQPLEDFLGRTVPEMAHPRAP